MATKLWRIVQKDLVCEWRARQAWPRMLLLGLVVAFLLNYQMAMLPGQPPHAAAALCWLTICFAAILSLGHSIAMERDDGCWEGLLLFPVAPQSVYMAKVVVSGLSLGALQLIVVPLFALACDTQWLVHPWKLLLVALLGNLGIASVGTLLGAMSAGMRQSQCLMAVLLLPLLVPMILAASEATRLLTENQAASEWCRWVQLLGAFTVIYLTAGWALFEFVVED